MAKVDRVLEKMIRILEKEFDVEVLDGFHVVLDRNGCAFFYYPTLESGPYGFCLKWSFDDFRHNKFYYDTSAEYALKYSFLRAAFGSPENISLSEHYVDKLDRVLPGLKRDYETLKEFVSELEDNDFKTWSAVPFNINSDKNLNIQFHVYFCNMVMLMRFYLDTYDVYIKDKETEKDVLLGNWDNLKSNLIKAMFPYISNYLTDEFRDRLRMAALKKEINHSDLADVINAL